MSGFELVTRGEEHRDIRLTVTNDRVTLKVPEDTPEERIAQLKKLSENIAECLRPLEKTVRGRVSDIEQFDYVTLSEENKHKRATVHYDSDMNVTRVGWVEGKYVHL